MLTGAWSPIVEVENASQCAEGRLSSATISSLIGHDDLIALLGHVLLRAKISEFGENEPRFRTAYLISSWLRVTVEPHGPHDFRRMQA